MSFDKWLTFTGIDPGLTGGIIEINYDGKIINNFVIPTYTVNKGTQKKPKNKKYINVRQLSLMMSKLNRSSTIYLESVHSMPGQGVSSTFRFGECFGMLKGILAAQNRKYELITPQKWTKLMHDGIDAEKAKDKSYILFESFDDSIKKSLYNITKSGRISSKVHSGKLDAYLIACYALSEYKKKEN